MLSLTLEEEPAGNVHACMHARYFFIVIHVSLVLMCMHVLESTLKVKRCGSMCVLFTLMPCVDVCKSTDVLVMESKRCAMQCKCH